MSTSSPVPSAQAGGSSLPLLALAVGAFGIGTTEFSPMGLLPVIADGVHVSIPTAGMLISAYAIGVMLGAPVMTLLLARASRRTALLLLMSIFTVGNLLSAVAPDYTTLLLARLVTSLNHGAFFGIGSVVAASIVPRERQASAVATMFMGLTIANVGGVPAATWLGQVIGWRMSFVATAGLGLIAMAGLLVALPRGEAGRMPDVRAELAVLTRPVVLAALATTVLGAGAMFTLYT
ncbi:MAG: Inner membrane transport protein YdhP [Burkholderia plantarii]|nr:MAG: Inner membrane transport protein YdhP [Burkholderia plantarii]